MSWRHRIALVLLTVLVSLPVSGTVCTLVCESSSDANATHHGISHKHHGVSRDTSEAAGASTGLQIGSFAAHDCNTHDVVVRQATTGADRADLTAKSAPVLVSVLHIDSVAALNSQDSLKDSSPLGTAPPTTTPLVLRV